MAIGDASGLSFASVTLLASHCLRLEVVGDLRDWNISRAAWRGSLKNNKLMSKWQLRNRELVSNNEDNLQTPGLRVSCDANRIVRELLHISNVAGKPY